MSSDYLIVKRSTSIIFYYMHPFFEKQLGNSHSFSLRNDKLHLSTKMFLAPVLAFDDGT